MSEPQGIDVSNIQGARFPWAGERGKIAFGMAKATEGLGFTDPDFAENWDAMWELSPTLCRFSYHFFHPDQDPTGQAERFVATVKAHGLLPGDNFVLDLETADGMTPEFTAGSAVTFLRVVNKLAPSHRVLVYTYPSFAEAGNCASMGSWYLWIANYDVDRPAVPAPWMTWTFWQFADAPVDRDCFNGTEAELLTFCRMPKSR